MAKAKRSAPLSVSDWTEDQRFSFANVEIEWNGIANRLSSTWQADSEDSFATKQWDALASHPVGLTLLAYPAFNAMLRMFDRDREKALAKWGRHPNCAQIRPADSIPLTRLIRYNARLHFFQAVARYAYGGAIGMWTTAPKNATAEQRHSAIKNAKGLLQALANGVRVSDSYARTDRLRDTLKGLIEALKPKPGKRKRLGDKSAGRRQFLGKLAEVMILRCGWCRPSVLVQFARLVDMPCDKKFAERIAKAEWQRWRQFAEEQHGEMSLVEILGG